MSEKKIHHPTGKPRMRVPSMAEQQAIKRSLNMKTNDRFFRCRGKAISKVRKFEEAGNMEHSDRKHLCDECRCSHVAGRGTDHYGVGYCYDHEGTTGMTKTHMEEMVTLQKEAIRQGYPDRVYKYKSNDAWLDEIREQAELSGGATDLREELSMLRSKAQDLISKFEDGRRNLTEGHDKDGNERSMTDATYYKLVATLMTSVGKLTQSNLAVTESDYVHVDQVNVWFANVVRIIKKTLETSHPDLYTEVIDQVKQVPVMKKGRIK